MRVRCIELVAAAGLVALTANAGRAQTAEMTFFVTSAGSGKGADLGGLAGADAICQRLAQAAGAGARTWRAYLSTQAADGAAAVNARDRIGAGPWRNAKGTVIASSVAELHGAAASLTKQTALTEKGEVVNGRGDTPNQHDILTGSQADGTAFGPGEDRTCGNYTRSGSEGAVMLGHHDRSGLDDTPPSKSWNMSHLSRGGCSQDALRSTGGAGLLYCFAAN
ncbi:MAG TPA: hypothetical protein VGO06_16335 [Bosea sp. (in: a-proteobacteria)]|jgi:hypothetical protein|uniref:hypothetical protein n=1 Tax=Bosea sp. (in: a-proteobacteria) TaxID=1871050 RepID=UPI002E102511|nr:hypothetical protein [Bosea sp. (in: a-proteobacteria)]